MDFGKTAGSFGSGALGVWLSVWNWAQYDFAPWFSKLWVTIVLWVIAIGAVGVGIIWDREFAKGLSPDAGLTASYQWAGVIISLAAVFLPSLSVLAFRNKAKTTGVVVAIMWLMVASASYMHSIGVQSRTIEAKYSQARSGTVADTVNVTAKTSVIDELRKQRETQLAEKEKIRADIQRSIDLFDDAIGGMSTSDGESVETLEQKRADAIAPIDAEIRRLDALIVERLSDTSAETNIAETELTEKAFDELYILLGRFLHGEEVTDAQITQIAIRTASYWAALIPFLGFLVSILFNFHLHMAERQQSEKQRIIKKARDLERAKKAAETRKRNRLTYDADFDEVTPDNDDNELEDEPDEPDIEPQDIEDDDDDKQQRPQAAE